MSLSELAGVDEEGQVVDVVSEDRKAALLRRVAELRLHQEATRIVRAEAAAEGWSPPWEGQSGLLSDLLAMQRPTEPWLVDRLMGWNHNVVLAAQHGSGKTTLGLNLVRSLVDGQRFLDRDVTPFEGRVGWVNGEMDPWDWADYARPLKIKHPERIESMHLRDARLPLINEYAAGQFAKWCVTRDVRALVFDSWRRLCAWCGLDENVNADVEQLTACLDEVKKAAGIHSLLILAHTGRAKAEEGEERVRGATALDDWVDGRWVMVKQGDQRYMFADKRGVEMQETALKFNPVNNRITLGEGNRRTAGNESIKLTAGMVLKAAGATGMLTGQLATELNLGKKTGPLNKALGEMVVEGLVTMTPAPRNGKKWTWIG